MTLCRQFDHMRPMCDFIPYIPSLYVEDGVTSLYNNPTGHTMFREVSTSIEKKLTLASFGTFPLQSTSLGCQRTEERGLDLFARRISHSVDSKFILFDSNEGRIATSPF